jgi:hypothetical protein
MKGNGQTQQKGFSFLMAFSLAALLVVTAKTVYDYRSAPIAAALADAKTVAYFAQHSEPFCAFEGVWYDWEDDETITLGCLEMKGNIREGSYSSATGPRATSNFSINGTYNIDSDSSMQVIGKDRDGKTVKFITMIYVEDPEYPTQMIVIDEKGEGSLYVWQKKSPG